MNAIRQHLSDTRIFGLAYLIKWPIALVINRLCPGYWCGLVDWAVGYIEWYEIGMVDEDEG